MSSSGIHRAIANEALQQFARGQTLANFALLVLLLFEG